ncbi:hypothetical protein [Pyxidicoccus sp. MSG2]|uniref:hypothetical protein n=1 Tax=Pyxidicoccus sp. MSG2 TaxID=2996790 RepID=UPI002271CB55|nr:hypothetical protein [Pyxidicoccus sp. MSG2]MCY1023230.1 hypothetical protein [Pyxidicoccus sp. MSG2]
MADTPPATTPERGYWRSSPLMKRLPLLILAGFGLWLWQRTAVPERELHLQFDGPGWSAVRAVDLQVVDDEGKVVKREERFYASGPPPEETFKMDLPEGTWHARLFVKVEGREARVRLEESLSVGEDVYIVRQLRLPPAGR